MKFFISCFGGAADPITATKPVVLPPSRTLRRKSHWRPALGSVSEETAAPPHRERTAMEASAGDVKKSDNSATTKSHRRHSSENCDSGSRRVIMAAMPAFSPTPFMF